MVGFFGLGGMRIDGYDEDLFNDMIRFRPDIVILNISGNDIHSKSEPKRIAEKVLALVSTLKSNGVKTVYFLEICERGRFPKDKKLTKKSFNAQRRKINKLLNKSGALQFVKLGMRFPKDYDKDKVHFSKPEGQRKFMYSCRRVLLSHRTI